MTANRWWMRRYGITPNFSTVHKERNKRRKGGTRALPRLPCISGGDQLDDISIEKSLEDMSHHLVHAFRKSGVRISDSFLSEIVYLIPDAEKTSSAFLGLYEVPREKTPKGRIILYTDAIEDYADYIGRESHDLATKIFFCLIYDYMNYMDKDKAGDSSKAERFAAKACKKLLKQGILKQMPPIFYFEYDNDNMYYQIILRQQWMERWTGMNMKELAEEVFGG